MAKNKNIKNLQQQEEEVIDNMVAQEVVATEEPQETVQTVEAENIAEIETEVSNVEEVVEPVIVKEEKKAKAAINETKPVEKAIVESPKNRSRHDQIQYVFTQPGLVKNSMIHNHY